MVKLIDLTDQRFGKLVALSFSRKNGETIWRCVCDCGDFTNVNAKSLRRGDTQSCGKSGCKITKLRLDLTGQKFGFLIAVKFENKKWLCRCDCGNLTYVSSNALKSGNTKSCGCKTLELSKLKKILPNNMAAVNHIYRSYKFSASKRNLCFDISIDKFLEFIYSNCFYCGSPPTKVSLILNSSVRCAAKEISYNGIDRKDNNIGYTSANCISCCRVCNRAKSDMAYDEFLRWLDRLAIFRSRDAA